MKSLETIPLQSLFSHVMSSSSHSPIQPEDAPRSGSRETADEQFHNRGNVSLFRRLWMCSAFLVIPLIFLTLDDSPINGDGSEYYVMAMALAGQGTPYVTPQVWSEYEQHRAAQPELNLSPSHYFTPLFDDLKNGDQQDFPHFWLYSVGAAIPYKLLSNLGLSLHQAFLVFHGLLAAAALLVVYRSFGLGGAGAFFVLWLLSPAFWYTDKVHTEFYTFCLGVMAFVLVIRGKALVPAVLFALMSAQNPLFGLAALACLAWFIWTHRVHPATYRSLILITLALGILALHPLYYFARFGALTPQLVTGAAGGFEGLKVAAIPVLDPNLGLLWGWPLGTFLLGASLFAIFTGRGKTGPITFLPVAIAILWMLLALYSHGSTGNQNHGVVIAVSRYAIWYIPLFFPVVVWLLRANWGHRQRVVFGVLAAFLGVFSLIQNWPSRDEFSFRPTLMGSFVMRAFPDVYDPYPQIFLNRYIGVTDWTNRPALALHPDSNKLLWDKTSLNYTLSTPEQSYDSAAYFNRAMAEYNRGDSSPLHAYYHLTDEQVEALLTPPPSLEYRVVELGVDENAAQYLGAGWHGGEGHHRWTSDSVIIRLPGDAVSAMLAVQARFAVSCLVTNLVTGKAERYELRDSEGAMLPLSVGKMREYDFVEFRIDIDGAWKPSERLSGNSDQRVLGVSALHITIYMD